MSPATYRRGDHFPGARREGRSLGATQRSPIITATAPDESGFEELGLRPELLGALAELGYEEPTPIQRAAIPPIIAGHDLLGQAATGTGKTAAFALPALQRIDPDEVRREPIALTLVPTRELAMQVAACPSRSRPASSAGIAARWMGVGSS